MLTTDDPARAKIVYTLSFKSVPDALAEPDRIKVDRPVVPGADSTCDLKVSLFHEPRFGGCEHSLKLNGPKGVALGTKKRELAHVATKVERCIHELMLTIPESLIRANPGQSYPCSVDFDQNMRAFFELRFGDSATVRASPARLTFGIVEKDPVRVSLAIHLQTSGPGGICVATGLAESPAPTIEYTSRRFVPG